MNITNLVFSKDVLEDLYEVTLTDRDIDIINYKLKGFSYEDMAHDTKLFKSLKDYTDYVYDDLDGYKYLIDRLVGICNEEPDAMYKTSDLLIADNKDIKLTDGKVILVMQ